MPVTTLVVDNPLVSAEDRIGSFISTYDPMDAGYTDREQQMAEAREDFGSFMRLMYPNYVEGDHLDTLRDTLVAVERGEIKRLIVTMPPRHSKSMHVSEGFPAWYLGRHYNNRVINASHTMQLARKFSRRVRNHFRDPMWPFQMVQISKESASVEQWEIEGSPTGGYLAVGVGGSPTGQGGDLIIIDDPIKTDADASSALIRENLWEWYEGTIFTRRQPDAAIIVTACMTGDTEVLMADGSTTDLRDIKIGDEIATYEDGVLATSIITNWINHGPDLVYEIKITSGTIVKANARHPFLVDRGGHRIWTRVRDLRAGDRLIRIAQSVEPGSRECRACGTGVTVPQSARGTAINTIAKSDGSRATVHRRIPTRKTERGSFVTDTGSSPESTIGCMQPREANAPSAARRVSPSSLETHGKTSPDACSSTIVMTPGWSVGCSATPVTLESGILVPRSFFSAPSTTYGGDHEPSTAEGPCAGRSVVQGPEEVEAQAQAEEAQDFTTEEIVSITGVGVEDVYDITVDRTENFIANGVVSHNTRWHEDDLTGRLLKAMDDGGEEWVHLHMPAQDDNGEYLWTEFWPVTEYEKAKMNSDRVWMAQYQGSPVKKGGNLIKDDWFAPIVPGETYYGIIQAWDCAEEPGVSNDWSVCTTIGISASSYDILHVWREQVEFPDLYQAAIDQSAWITGAYAGLPYTCYVENASAGRQLVQTLRRYTKIPVEPVNTGNMKDAKVQRVIRNTPIFKSRRVRVPVKAAWKQTFFREMKGFPYEAHDDVVDSVMIGVEAASGGLTGSVGSKDYLSRNEDSPFDISRRRTARPPGPRAGR